MVSMVNLSSVTVSKLWVRSVEVDMAGKCEASRDGTGVATVCVVLVAVVRVAWWVVVVAGVTTPCLEGEQVRVDMRLLDEVVVGQAWEATVLLVEVGM